MRPAVYDRDMPRRLPLVWLLLALAAACAPAPSASDLRSAPLTPPPSPSLAGTPAPVATATRIPAPTPQPPPASAIVPGSIDRTSLDLAAVYAVDLTVDVATGALRVVTTIGLTNDSDGGIDRLELNTIAARLGEIDVTEASVDGRPVDIEIDDQTVVVPLGGILPEGEVAEVQLTYAATLRPDLDGSDWLFSRAGGTLALYRWIPWVSRATPFDRPNHGDPFVTPSSPRVRIHVATDRPMVLAAAAPDPGPTPGPGPGGTDPGPAARAWTFEVNDVRDVAIVLAPDFAVTTGEAEGIPIRAYTRPGGLDGQRLVAQAAHALTTEASRIGVEYPLPAYSVVETTGGYGMESPGLTWIPRGTTAANLPYLVHHETAHQWFYGLVGNDQQAQPFADEAAADLLARTVLGAIRASRCDPAPLDRPITRYSQACYYEVIYIQGGNVLDDVRAAMGSEPFWAAMGDYVEANRDGLGGTRQLLEALRAASPVDLLPILRARFPDLY